jgi:probable O-glycosylation ligase (exosortase A-associated)
VRDVLLIVGAGGSALVALRLPVYGLITLVVLSLLSPQSFVWGMARTVPWSQLVAGATIIGFLFSAEPKAFLHRQPAIRFTLLLWGVFAFSSMFAFHPDRAWDSLVQVSKILLIVVLSTALINTAQRLEWLLRAIALTLGFYGAKAGLFAVFNGGEQLVLGPELGFLAANNSMGMALAMNVPVLFYVAKQERSWWMRRLMLTMLVLSYPGTIFTYSRGAWLGLGAATALMIWGSRRRYSLIGMVCLILIAVMPFAWDTAPERLRVRYDSLKNYATDTSAQSRFWNWEFCFRIGVARPITGAGFDLYGVDAYEAFFPEFLDRWPGKVWSCHSAWLTMFAEHGVAGFAVWLALLASTFLTLYRIRTAGRVRPDGDRIAGYARGMAISLFTFCIVGTFLDIAYFDLFYHFIAVVAVCAGLQDSQRSDRATVWAIGGAERGARAATMAASGRFVCDGRDG